MKLLFCPHCTDAVKIKLILTECECGKCVAVYRDHINIDWNGQGILLGINNSSLRNAILTDRAGIDPTRGTDFIAFTISPKAESVKIVPGLSLT